MRACVHDYWRVCVYFHLPTCVLFKINCFNKETSVTTVERKNSSLFVSLSTHVLSRQGDLSNFSPATPVTCPRPSHVLYSLLYLRVRHIFPNAYVIITLKSCKFCSTELFLLSGKLHLPSAPMYQSVLLASTCTCPLHHSSGFDLCVTRLDPVQKTHSITL